MRIFNSLVAIVSVVFPFTALPQISKVWLDKNIEGVSLLTWSLFLAFTIILLIDSAKKGDKKITIMWALWTIIDASMVLGILIHS